MEVTAWCQRIGDLQVVLLRAALLRSCTAIDHYIALTILSVPNLGVRNRRYHDRPTRWACLK